MKLLNQGNSKTVKGEKFGFRTFGLHLSPADKSGFNVCKWASKGCKAACLDTAGRGAMSNVQKARANKTLLFFKDREKFMCELVKEIKSAIKSAEKKGLIPCFRLNLTSDLPWESIKHEGQTVLDMFPEVQFYDYTKGFDRMMKSLQDSSWPKNYHLTFSRSEVSKDDTLKHVLSFGGNVAVVFRGSLPSHYLGAKVVDGDESDLRFKDDSGKIVGLVEKGLAKKDSSGFVVEGQA